MKKMMAVLILTVLCSSVAKAEDATKNPFVYESGKLSFGVVSGDTLALYDIFKHVDGVTARVGGSLTLAKYDRFGAFVGAAAPTSEPANVACVGGPSLELDDVAKSMLTSMLKVLPFKIADGTVENIAKAARLKVYGGYDFRNKQIIAGAGFGVGLF